MIEAQPIQTRVESFSKPSLDMPMGRDYIPPRYGPSVDEPQKTIEINRRQANAATSSQTGAFYGLIVVEGVTYLQGGTCTGGDGTKTFADIEVIAADGTPAKASGWVMYIEATGNGITANDVLLPGWNLTPASTSIAYDASSVPSNTLPTGTSATGKKCYVRLGSFTDTGFSPDAIGNVQITFCPGAYNVTRS